MILAPASPPPQSAVRAGSPTWILLLSFSVWISLITGCEADPSPSAATQTQANTPSGAAAPGSSQAVAPDQRAESQASDERPPVVDVVVTQTGSLEGDLDYTGTTQPVRWVSLRSRIEGQLLNLEVDTGDPVEAGQMIGEIDAILLQAVLTQAQAELAASRSDVARAEAQVESARNQVEQARIEFEQAQADAQRLQDLVAQGAVSTQQAELAQTAAEAADQSLRIAQQQVRNLEQAVIAAQGREDAQQAVVDQAEERQTYARLEAPITGIVLQRASEPGNLVRSGDEILTLGDFSDITVEVQVSELDLSQIQLGQSVDVRLDAFPDQPLIGTVTRISPAADPTARLIPVEVTIPNAERQIGSGLLARLRFTPTESERIVIPQSALERVGGSETSESSGTQAIQESQEFQVFVVESEGDTHRVGVRSVQIGDTNEDRAEILSGLAPGEAVVIRSSQPLQDGQLVRLSILSEIPTAEAGSTP